MLSAAEQELIQNAELILTKNRILQKVMLLLQQVQEQMQDETADHSSPLFSVPPKISKGENYLGLPYVVLDYPRISNGADLCFVRSFFWWGNFFSSTLQLAGSFKQKHLAKIQGRRTELCGHHYFIGMETDPWQHHFEANNYLAIQELNAADFEQRLTESVHIKLAKRWPLSEWNEAAAHLLESWRFLLTLTA